MDTLPFSELVETNPRVKIEKAKEYPFVEMGVIEPGRRYVRSDQSRIFQNGGAKFLSGDTLFARITPCLENGKIAQYQAPSGQAGFGSTEFFVFRARQGLSDPGFVYYLANSDLIRKPAEKSMSGASGRQRADLKSIVDLEVPAPPLSTQRKIAAILSAYDGLIENNLQRIKILEEMAQNLYHEWFVKCRFPGHQQVRFTDSPLGRIPEGWEVVKVGELLKKVKRGTKIQKQDYAAEGLIPVVDQGKEFIGGYTDNSESLIFDDLPLIVFGDHTRALKFIDFPFACGADGTQLLKSRDERMPMTLFYYALLSIDLSDFAYARHFKFLKEETLVIPVKSIADQFDLFVLPLRLQIKSLMQKNITLRRTRDLLLPKLISGEVEVSELDITIPEEVGA